MHALSKRQVEVRRSGGFHHGKCIAFAGAGDQVNLFKVVTVKNEIVIGLSDDEMKALGGSDASTVAHALAQKGDMMVWQYNAHRGPNADMPRAPIAKIAPLPTHRCASSPIPRPAPSFRISKPASPDQSPLK
jgi:hypothetical protein